MLWGPNYRLSPSLRQRGPGGHRAGSFYPRRATGMRKVTIGPGKVAGQPAILLNGKPLFQHGPLDQGWWPDGLHTPPSDEAMKWEISWLRQSGFNMMRKHIKVEPARYYYHCDHLGMLVWQDMPAGFNQALRNSRSDVPLGALHDYRISRGPPASTESDRR